MIRADEAQQKSINSIKLSILKTALSDLDSVITHGGSFCKICFSYMQYPKEYPNIMRDLVSAFENQGFSVDYNEDFSIVTIDWDDPSDIKESDNFFDQRLASSNARCLYQKSLDQLLSRIDSFISSASSQGIYCTSVRLSGFDVEGNIIGTIVETLADLGYTTNLLEDRITISW